MNDFNKLKIRIESFSKLKEDWDSYGAGEISIPSIMTAHKVLDKLSEMNEKETIGVFPMDDGGVRIELGDLKEIEVDGYIITEINFYENYNIRNKVKMVFK